MKKIMFNDKYGLTEAVLECRKTQTRRVINLTDTDKEYLDTAFDWDFRESVIIGRYAKYKVGEVVAVAQKYLDFRKSDGDVTDDFYRLCCAHNMPLECLSGNAGANNKMFVKAELMPHHICITNIRVERLQDISEEDVIKEGFERVMVNNGWGNFAHHNEYLLTYIEEQYGRYKQIGGRSAKDSYAALIDKVSGKGTWESNPWVFVYDFELVD